MEIEKDDQFKLKGVSAAWNAGGRACHAVIPPGIPTACQILISETQFNTSCRGKSCKNCSVVRGLSRYLVRGAAKEVLTEIIDTTTIEQIKN